MPQFFGDNTEIPLDGIEEVVINSVDSDLIFMESTEATLKCECNWRDELGHPEIIREGKRMIVRFHERGVYVNLFGLFIGKSRTGTGYGALENAQIRVPKAFPILTVNTVSGNIDTEALSLTDKCQLNSFSGDIRSKSLHAKICAISTKSGDLFFCDANAEHFSANTFSGNTLFENCEFKKASVKSKSGDIRIKNPCSSGEELFVESLSGDIELEQAPLISKINTVSGDIRFESVQRGPIDWNIKTVSGNVGIDTVHVDAALFFSTISGELSFKNTKPRFSSKNEYIIGDGENGRIIIHTVSGDAHLRITETIAQGKSREGTSVEAEKREPVDKSVEQDKDYKEYAKRFVFPDESVLKIVQMNKQGIITHEESIELLKAMGYNDDEIARFLLNGENSEP